MKGSIKKLKNNLEQIFKKYNVNITSNNENRDAIDILEDIYLKITGDEWNRLCQDIANIESAQGDIFDEARNRPYKP
jgi:hypothetical protein